MTRMIPFRERLLAVQERRLLRYKEARTPVYWDTETTRIKMGEQVPKLVCLTHVTGAAGEPHILATEDACDWFASQLEDHSKVLYAFNTPFDVLVMLRARPSLVKLVLEAYADDRLLDLYIIERILDTAAGSLMQGKQRLPKSRESVGAYSLAGCLWRNCKIDRGAEKTGDVRVTYGQYLGRPVSEFSEDHIRYALDDVLDLPKLHAAQLERAARARQSLVDIYGSEAGEQKHVLADVARQGRADLGLKTATARGMKVDVPRAWKVYARDLATVKALEPELMACGILRADGSCDTKVLKSLIEKAYLDLGYDSPPMTTLDRKAEEKRQRKRDRGETVEDWVPTVSTSRKTKLASGPHCAICKDEELEDKSGCTCPLLVRYARTGAASTRLSNFLPSLLLCEYGPYHASYQILVETGRTSSWGRVLRHRDVGLTEHPNRELQLTDLGIKAKGEARRILEMAGLSIVPKGKAKIGGNVQNQSRKGGIRECFVARPGYIYVAADYDSAELRGLGQVLLDTIGVSRLAAKYQADPGYDPHTDFAAFMMGIDYAAGMHIKGLKKSDGHPRYREFKDYRQLAKALNFGLPGGMGIASFREFAADAYGVVLSYDEALAAKKRWFQFFPEIKRYHKLVGRKTAGPTQKGLFRHLRSHRYRGNTPFCGGCNTLFQGISADFAKEAIWRVTMECWGDETSPLYGSRLVGFVHDELILESPADKARGAAARLEEVMAAAGAMYCPDVPVTASAQMMLRWSKDAEPVYDKETGELQVWEPERKAAS